MRFSDLLPPAIATLRDAGIEEAAGDARRLLAHAAAIAPARLTLHLPDEVSAEVAARFEALIAARAERRPVSHLTGKRAFYGREFVVTPDVLDPRPETETLVELALARPWRRVLDLGTGSGAILVTLLAEEPLAKGVGTDISLAALEVADRNARSLGVHHRMELIRADWDAGIEGQFDLIVSNPPYIAADEMAGLAPEVREFEPRIALTDEGDGLGAYRAIATLAPRRLAAGGSLLVEIGRTQGSAVAGLLTAAGLSDVAVTQDLSGHDRVVSAKAPGTLLLG